MAQELKRRRIFLLTAAGLAIITLAVLYLLGTVLLTVGLSVVIAYALLPAARLLERAMPWRSSRPGLSRGIAVGVIFIAALGIIAGALVAIIPPTVEQSRQFAEEFPDFFRSARQSVEGWVNQYVDQIPVEVRDQIEETLSDSSALLGDFVLNAVSQTWQGISGSFSLILGLATAPVLIFYLMKDSGKIRSSLYAPFPAELQSCLKDLLNIAEKTLGGYIRGQLTLGLAVGAVVAVGLLLLGVPFSFILGIVAGLTEMVPVVGPWIGGIVGVVVTLATAPDKVPWVILLYVAVQLLENTFLVPRIQGDTLNLHPVAIIVIILIASNYFGIWGVILGPPLVAMLKDMGVWFVREWQRPEGEPILDSAPDGNGNAESGPPAEPGEMG